MRLIKLTYLIIFITSFLSCNNQDKIEEYKIIELFIHKVIPFPLPPPPALDAPRGLVLSKKVMDSIMKRKIIIGLNTEMKPFSKIEYKGNDSDFLELTKRIDFIKDVKIISIPKIVRSKNRVLVEDKESIRPHEGMEFEDYDVRLVFSRVIFNDALNKAIIVVGENRSRLSGNTSIFYLMKEKGKWVIIDNRVLFVS